MHTWLQFVVLQTEDEFAEAATCAHVAVLVVVLRQVALQGGYELRFDVVSVEERNELDEGLDGALPHANFGVLQQLRQLHHSLNLHLTSG